MILTKKEIIKLINKKRIIIKGLNKYSIGTASIDLTIDKKIRIFNFKQKIIEEDIDYKKITKLVDISKGYLLKPGELILGITKEKITLPDNICGFLNSRSRYARIGLMSHITAPFISPGVSNKQVLEIYNAGPNKIKLMPGKKICHLVLAKCKGKAKYNGKWRNQDL
jgi:dCTP deaminase